MIDFYIKGQQLKVSQPKIVDGTIKYLEATFHFSSIDWLDLSKWAHFEKGEEKYLVTIVDNKITAERGLNLGEGVWNVYLHGDGIDGTRITTETVQVTVEGNSTIHNYLPEFSQSAEEQLAAMVQEASNKADDAYREAKKTREFKEAAEQSAADSEKNRKDSSKFAENAKNSELNAADSADQAGKLAASIRGVESTVKQYMETTSDKANLADTKAAEALNSANDAAESVRKAKISETNAKNSENNAANSASSANTSKQEAANSASIATQIKNEIPTTIDNALQEAKDSGMFKGDKGDKGDKGATGGFYYPEMHINEHGDLIVEGVVDNSSIDFQINGTDLEVIING